MLSAGYSEGEVDPVPSEYVVADIEQGAKDAGLLTGVRQQISKALGSEAEFGTRTSDSRNRELAFSLLAVL